MKKHRNYLIIVGVISGWIVLYFFSIIVLNNIEQNVISIGLENNQLELNRGRYYIFNPDNSGSFGYEINDNQDALYLVDTAPLTDYSVTIEFDLYRDTETINIDSILNEHRDNNRFGFAFATFAIEETDQYQLDIDVEITNADFTYIPTYEITKTNPRMLSVLEFVEESIRYIPVFIFFMIPIITVLVRKSKQ